MKKKLLTVALAATMVVSSVFSAFAAETKIDNKTLGEDTYEEMANPLKGKNAKEVTISYTINWQKGAARNGWDGIFSFFDASSNARVSFQTAPYICYNANSDATPEKWYDVKADAWCTNNCEEGKDYTFVYKITADKITVTCDGTAIAEFKEVGRGTGAAASGYQEILDAFNTYPTLTIGVGIGKSAFWNTEKCTLSITINDGANNGTPDTQEPTETQTQAGGNDPTDGGNPQTGDTTPVAVMAIVALGAAVAVVASRKKVTE